MEDYRNTTAARLTDRIRSGQTEYKGVVVVVLYRRPDYTSTLLSALGKCYGISDYHVIISCDVATEHAADCAECIRLAHKFASQRGGHAGTTVMANYPRIGIDTNKYNAILMGFNMCDYVILFEDDVPPSRDALRFFEACDRLFRDDQTVLAACGYNRCSTPQEHMATLRFKRYALSSRRWFHPWGWAMWLDRFERYIGDGSGIIDRFGPSVNNSFDRFLTDIVIPQVPHLRTIHPVMPRTNHAGFTRAEHTPSAKWLRDHEYSYFGAWSQEMPDPDPGVWNFVGDNPSDEAKLTTGLGWKNGRAPSAEGVLAAAERA